jgi:hypothetical protein
MKRFSYLVLLVVILLTACGGESAQPTATEALISPTDTPVPPTSTPLPTHTPTQTPTSTPDAAATAAAQSTQTAGEVLTELDKLLGDTDIPYKDGRLVWQQSKPAKIEMQGPQSTDQILPVDEKLSVKDFIMTSDVAWNASGVIICGAIFRSETDLEHGKKYEFYFYRLSGLPAYFIDVYENSVFLNSITKDRYSKELNVSNDATNRFTLVAQDNQFTVYLNGKRQGRFFDNSKQLAEGYFGFLGWQESGTGRCEFSNSWIWSLDK